MPRRTRTSVTILTLLIASLPLVASAGDATTAGGAPVVERFRDLPLLAGGFLVADNAGSHKRQSREALFDDEEASAGETPADQASPQPASREALFGDDLPAAGAATPPNAGAASEASGIKGFIQNTMAYTVRTPRHWSEMMTRADLSAQGNLGAGVKWKLGARVDYDATYTLTDFYPQKVAEDQRFNVLLRENYLDIGAGSWDFRLGRQHVVWGEVVGLFFADVVSARDMRQFILPDFEIMRIPQWAARAEYFKNDFHAELLWIPIASYDEIGKPGSEFYSHTLPAPAGVATVFRNEKQPSRSLSHTNYGLRLSMLRDGWDVAAFAYSSMSAAPTFYREVVVAPQPTVYYQARHDRIHQYGGTVAKDLGPVVLKGEAVYTRGQRYQVTRLADPDGVVRQDTLNWIVGVDYTELADTRINVQFFQSHFFDHDRDILQSRNENGYSALINHKFGDRIEGQVLWISSFNRTDWLLRPRVSWNFEKNWRLVTGVDIFQGPPAGFFGRYDNRDRVFTELRYSF